MAHSCASLTAVSAAARADDFRAPSPGRVPPSGTAERRGVSGRSSPCPQLLPPAYAVVYAETGAGQVIALRPPFVAGAGRRLQLPVTLVFPGETFFTAARRTLFEQTGYESDCWQPLGELPAHAAPAGSPAQLFRVWRARPTAEIWTDGLTVPTVATVSPLELAGQVHPGPQPWFDLATVLTLANPRRWRTHSPP